MIKYKIFADFGFARYSHQDVECQQINLDFRSKCETPVIS